MNKPASCRYQITHKTHYRYSSPVALSHQLVHKLPRACAWQTCHAQSLTVIPAPCSQLKNTDAFGNPVVHLSLETPHDTLSLTSQLDISVRARPAFPPTSPAWESVRDLFDYTSDTPLALDILEASQFRYESPGVRLKKQFVQYGHDCFDTDVPLLNGAQALMKKIYSEFTFDSHATEITTPLLVVLEERRGVCQDFAHLMVACLRSRGMAARYVSGYLLTTPPEGQPRLVGADASHAWVSVYCPQNGWIDFDPTNNMIPACEHITLAWGRDFTDVSPLRGVVLGGGKHTVDVNVTVIPVAP